MRRRALRRGGGALLAASIGGGIGINVLDEGRTATVLTSLIPATVDYQVVSWQVRNAPEAKVKEAFDDYHARWADEPLRVIMKLRGFYVKTGQVLAGQPDVLPPAYGASLKVLQDSVPAQPFDVVRAIVEEELGCGLEEVFASFDEAPLGAASIGQVHRATLRDGSEVVVKVQYPMAEKFFRLDIETIKAIFRVANPEFVGVIECIEAAFEQEFDYVQEARCLRFAVERFEPKYRGRGVRFPEPYDAAELATARCASLRAVLPPALRASGLVTRKVLVMTRCPGRTVSKIGAELLEAYAAKRGQSAAEFVEEMSARAKEPGYVEEVLANQRSAQAVETYRWALRSFDRFANFWFALWNATVGWLHPRALRLEYRATVLPPNGPAIVELLYDVHGFQLFDVGSFNADCHAGNVLVDEASGNVSLIDYGQLIGPVAAEKVRVRPAAILQY